jgi:hypothetical protein
MQGGSGKRPERHAAPTMAMKRPDSIFGSYDTAFRLYEDGKHRRYELLFAVNGGAFTIAKLFSEPNTAKFLGNLSLNEVAYGLAAFTVLMTVDMMVFGQRMRSAVGDDKLGWFKGVFSLWGKGVLALVSLLIVVGWLLVRPER